RRPPLRRPGTGAAWMEQHSLFFLPCPPPRSPITASLERTDAGCRSDRGRRRNFHATDRRYSMGMSVAMNVIGRVGEDDAEASDHAFQLGAERPGALVQRRQLGARDFS